MRLSVLVLHKKQQNECLNVFPSMTELGFSSFARHTSAGPQSANKRDIFASDLANVVYGGASLSFYSFLWQALLT